MQQPTLSLPYFGLLRSAGRLALGSSTLHDGRRAARPARCRKTCPTAGSASSRADTRPRCAAARRLNRAAGTLAVSVLADSAIEHYRGSFENKAMFTPLDCVGLDARRRACTARPIPGPSPTGFGTRSMCSRPLPAWSAPAFTSTMSARRPGGFSLAESVLRRPARRTVRDSAVRAARLLLRAGARHASAAGRRRFSVFRPGERWQP